MTLRYWLRPKPVPWGKLENSIEVLAEEIGHLRRERRTGMRELLERMSGIMATVQEFRDALNEQNQAILDEVTEINNKLAQAGNIPDDVLQAVRSNTDQIRNIINEPLPEPVPEPNPNPEPEPPTRGRR